MQEWEYQTRGIVWKQGDSQSGWVADPGARPGDMQDILTELGSDGWELVSVVAEGWSALGPVMDVKCYRAFLKRPAQ
jgi:hypothetical protein